MLAQEHTFRFGNDRTGSLDSKVPDTGSLLWAFTTEDQVQTTPIPYDNKVFFGSDDGNVYALDAMWGTELWRFDTQAPVIASPTISENGVLYIGSTSTVFYALDIETGEELWSWKVPDRLGQIRSTAAIEDGNAYFGTSDRRFYSVNLTEHGEEWNFSTGNEIWSSPAIWKDRVYFGSLDGNMYCLWKKNGTLAWNFSTTTYEGVYSTPALVDGKVVFSAPMGDNGLYVLDALTGELVWRFQFPGPSYGSPAVHNGVIFSPAWGPPGRLFALPLVDPSPGDRVLEEKDILWSSVINDEQGGSSPLYSRGRVIVGSDLGMGDQGRLFCFNASTGEPLWNFSTGGDVYSSPSLLDGVVFIGSIDGRLYAIGGDPDAKMEVEIILGSGSVQGGRVIGISFLVSYRGIPLEGAYIKIGVSDGELSQSGGSTFPDGSQRIKFQAPDVKVATTISIEVKSTFIGLDDAQDNATIEVIPASNYRVESTSDFNILNYALYLGLSSFLIIANVAIVILTRRVQRSEKKGGKG